MTAWLLHVAGPGFGAAWVEPGPAVSYSVARAVANGISQVMFQAHAGTALLFVLGIAAEGTRSKGEFWKSGFYRIAQQSGLPITLAFLDAPSRTVGWGPTFSPSGDVRADMDRIRAFYADKTGLKPENFTPPRLREEPGSS